MMPFNAVVALFSDLDAAELTDWIEQRWVQPERTASDAWTFYEIDVARVHLIYDLRRHLETPVETVPLLLSLLDQVYELRRQLKAMTHAIEKQPADVRASIIEALRADSDEP
jgi:chaperone modulatory protein CbpM